MACLFFHTKRGERKIVFIFWAIFSDGFVTY